MGYDDIETGLQTLIQGIEGYDTTNVSKGDYRIFSAGLTKGVVLNPGPVPSRSVIAAPRKISTTWEIEIDLRIAFTDEISTIASSIRTERQAIFDHIDKYPTLNRATTGVTQALIVSARQPNVWQGESKNWWSQLLICRVSENVVVSLVENRS